MIDMKKGIIKNNKRIYVFCSMGLLLTLTVVFVLVHTVHLGYNSNFYFHFAAGLAASGSNRDYGIYSCARHTPVTSLKCTFKATSTLKSR